MSGGRLIIGTTLTTFVVISLIGIFRHHMPFYPALMAALIIAVLMEVFAIVVNDHWGNER